MNKITDKKTKLQEAIKKATNGTNVKYIICEDILGFEKHESELKNNKYIIQQFGDYYVAFIF